MRNKVLIISLRTHHTNVRVHYVHELWYITFHMLLLHTFSRIGAKAYTGGFWSSDSVNAHTLVHVCYHFKRKEVKLLFKFLIKISIMFANQITPSIKKIRHNLTEFVKIKFTKWYNSCVDFSNTVCTRNNEKILKLLNKNWEIISLKIHICRKFWPIFFSSRTR